MIYFPAQRWLFRSRRFLFGLVLSAVGTVGLVTKVPWHVNAILVVSGLLCIGIAHPLYYPALKELGLSVCATILLSTPVGTLLLSHWIFGEVLTAGQIMFGLVHLSGGAFTILVSGKTPPVNVTRAVEPAET